MSKKRVKFSGGGGGGGGEDADDIGDENDHAIGAEDDEEDGDHHRHHDVVVVAEDDDDDDDNEQGNRPHHHQHKTLLQLTTGINGETAKQSIESAVYQFAVGVMFVRKCLVSSCGASDTYTYNTELMRFYTNHPHLKEKLGPGHAPPGNTQQQRDDDDDDMHIPK